MYPKWIRFPRGKNKNFGDYYIYLYIYLFILNLPINAHRKKIVRWFCQYIDPSDLDITIRNIPE